MSKHLRLPWMGMALVVVLGAGLLGGVAIAQNGGDTFYACLTNGGDLEKVSTEAAPVCRGNKTPVSWNAEGPAGPPGGGGFGEAVSATTFKLAAADCPSDEYKLVVASQIGTVVPWQPGDCKPIIQVPSDPIIANARTSLDVDSVPALEGAWMDFESTGGWTFLNDGAWTINCIVLEKTAPSQPFPEDDLVIDCAVQVGANEQDRLAEVLDSEVLESRPLVFLREPSP